MENIPEYIRYILVFLSGLIAAFINVMAGGGSAISVGLMTLFGIPATVANGTNRVGVVTAGISSVKTFHDKGKLDIKGALPFAILALGGSLIGAYGASILSAEAFKKYLAFALIFVICTLFIPKREETGRASKAKKWLSFPIMFLVGLYGGFIQAGVGFLIMATYRHLQNLDLVTINGRKMLITTIFTVPAIIIFALQGQINWGYAVVLAVGNFIGGKVATTYALKKGDKVVKYVLAVAIGLIALKFLGVL